MAYKKPHIFPCLDLCGLLTRFFLQKNNTFTRQKPTCFMCSNTAHPYYHEGWFLPQVLKKNRSKNLGFCYKLVFKKTKTHILELTFISIPKQKFRHVYRQSNSSDPIWNIKHHAHMLKYPPSESDIIHRTEQDLHGYLLKTKWGSWNRFVFRESGTITGVAPANPLRPPSSDPTATSFWTWFLRKICSKKLIFYSRMLSQFNVKWDRSWRDNIFRIFWNPGGFDPISAVHLLQIWKRGFINGPYFVCHQFTEILGLGCNPPPLKSFFIIWNILPIGKQFHIGGSVLTIFFGDRLFYRKPMTPWHYQNGKVCWTMHLVKARPPTGGICRNTLLPNSRPSFKPKIWENKNEILGKKTKLWAEVSIILPFHWAADREKLKEELEFGIPPPEIKEMPWFLIVFRKVHGKRLWVE